MSVRRMRAMLKALRDEVCPEHRPAVGPPRLGTGGPTPRPQVEAMPSFTWRGRLGRATRTRLRFAAAAAGGLLAAGMIVLAAAAASGAAADRASPGESALVRTRQGTATTLVSG